MKKNIKIKKIIYKYFYNIILVVSLFNIYPTTASAVLFLGNQNHPPVVYLENNIPTGIAVDITKALQPYLSEQIEIKAMNWPEAQSLVKEGKADVLIQINETDERRIIYDFSDILLESKFSIFTSINRFNISGLSSLNGLSVGVEAGGFAELALQANPGIKLVVISSIVDGFKQVSDGNIDAVVIDYRVGAYILAKNNIKNIKVSGDPIELSHSSFAVKKGNTKLLDEINVALQTIKRNGVYQAILNKWQSSEVVFKTEQQITRDTNILVTSILFILALIIIAWTITINRELTKRKEAEKYSDDLIRSANAMIIGLDLSGKVIVFNEMAQKVSGYKKDEALGHNWFELVVPHNNFKDIWGGFEELLRQGKSKAGDFQNLILTKDEDERIIEWRNSNLHDNGKVVGIILYGIDVTERVIAEESLRVNDERFRAAQAISKVGNWEYNIQTMQFWGSDEAKRIFGFDSNQDDFTTEEVEKCISERGRVHKALIDLIEKNSKYSLEYKILPKGSLKPRFVTSIAKLSRDKQGKALNVVGVIQDITERKKTEERLKELDKLKDDFLMITTHELRTPLVPIKSQCQLLLAGDYGEINAKQRSALEMIYRNEESLNMLAGDVLDVAKIKSNKMQVVKTPCHLEKIVANVVEDLKQMAERKHITLSLGPLPEIPIMQIDGSRIRQTFANLIENAIKFTPEKGNIKVEMQKEIKSVSISVTDNGIGISQENIPKLFEPFIQIQNNMARKQRGTGLGLVVTKGLIEAHGGTIRVESLGEGKGSTFIVLLPLP